MHSFADKIPGAVTAGSSVANCGSWHQRDTPTRTAFSDSMSSSSNSSANFMVHKRSGSTSSQMPLTGATSGLSASKQEQLDRTTKRKADLEKYSQDFAYGGLNPSDFNRTFKALDDRREHLANHTKKHNPIDAWSQHKESKKLDKEVQKSTYELYEKLKTVRDNPRDQTTGYKAANIITKLTVDGLDEKLGRSQRGKF